MTETAAGKDKGPVYVLSGGGTGGHVSPGLAVAEEILVRFPTARCVFIGSERPVERRMVVSAGWMHVALPVRSSTELRRHPLSSLSSFGQTVYQARRLFRELRPVAVIGLGGFASLPMVLMAQMKGVPTILLEQNTIPGRVTRWAGKYANRVCLTYPESAERLPRGTACCVTGNPVRAELVQRSQCQLVQAVPTLLVLGGSQGATSLNRLVADALPTCRSLLQNWRIVHQTGQHDVATVQAAYQVCGLKATVQPFFDDLGEFYQQAHLVVSRAGATTLAELVLFGCPTLLVPLATSSEGHQQRNADFYAERGAAQVISGSSEAGEVSRRFTESLRELLANPERRSTFATAFRELAQPGAAQTVVDVLEDVVAGRSVLCRK